MQQSPDIHDMEDRKSLFKYFSTQYTNKCLTIYLLNQYYMDEKLSSSTSSSTCKHMKKKTKNKYGRNPLIYYQGLYLFLSRKVHYFFYIIVFINLYD